jgi:hypothetical protein
LTGIPLRNSFIVRGDLDLGALDFARVSPCPGRASRAVGGEGTNRPVSTDMSCTGASKEEGMPMRVSRSRARIAVGVLLAIGGLVLLNPATPLAMPNSPTNPDFVRDVDNPARSPFQTSVTVDNLGGGPDALIPVPVGVRLVIEFVSANCSLSNGVPLSMIRFTTNVDHFFSPTSADAVQATMTQPTRMYAEPGTNVRVHAFNTTNPATTLCKVSVSGYLIKP